MVWKLHTKSIKDIEILKLDGIPSARILYTCANHALWNHTNKAGFIPLKLSLQYKSVVSVSETTTVVSVCIKYQDNYIKYVPLLNIQTTYFVWKIYPMSVILKHSTALKLRSDLYSNILWRLNVGHCVPPPSWLFGRTSSDAGSEARQARQSSPP